MTDIELVKIIAQKIGHEYEETSRIISGKIGYVINNNHIIQLCINNCNLMNETIPQELWQLYHLKVLCLSTNMLSQFPEDILQLHDLVRLDLNGNQIRAITGKIKELRCLESLDLAGNQLETLPIAIGQLPALKKLRLNTNRLISLPTLDPDAEWLQLESIDLDGADMKELPLWLFSLQSLKYLSLSKLHLNHFPESICNLKKLEGLFLDSTQFPLWPNRILLPANMRYIVLDGAHFHQIIASGICRIPDAIIELKPKYVRNQKSIDKNDLTFQVSLGGNVSAGLDESQLFHDNPMISYNYLRNLYSANEAKDELFEYGRLKDIKVVLLGSGAVGKTSLVQRLHLSDPDDDNIALESVQTTHGVNIDYHLNLYNIWDKTRNRYESFTAHFWDFGGQDKYRGINKLLLTDKAIYIIVLDSRAQSMPDVWLEMIKIYAPHSKIILVANKIDENPRLNLNFKYYCEKYPQLYNCLFKISCKYPASGINKIADITSAIKKIIEEQMDLIAPIGRIEWFKIQAEIEKEYHVCGKVLLSVDEYSKICNSYGLLDKSAQSQLLSTLSICGSCIAIEDEEFSILSPNWLADYLYLFYSNLGQKKALMDYKKEYIPMLKKLKDYSDYKELITDYLEQRGLCTIFLDGTNSKKIFIPMFLPEEGQTRDYFPQEAPLLTYKFQTTIIPEYEFQKFLVREFSKIREVSWDAWQFGLYFVNCNSKVYIQLTNDGITLKIWANEVIECGRCFQWIRNSMLSTSDKGFFNEYILVENENRKGLLPYKTLEILNSWDLSFYCLPEQNDAGTLIPIDIKEISQKCGLKCKLFDDEHIDENLQYRKMIEYGGVFLKVEIKNMHGDIKHYETHGEQSPIILSENNSDSELMQAILDLKDKISSAGTEFDDLRSLLDRLERSNPENKMSIKNRINDWMSRSANIITIGTPLYCNRQAIFDGLQHLLNILSK